MICYDVQGLTSVQTNDEYSIDVYQSLMKQNNHSINSDKHSNTTFGTGDNIGSEDDGGGGNSGGNSGGETGGGGLPCRVFLTPVYEETLPENNHSSSSSSAPLSSSSSSATTATSSTSMTVSPSAMATATKHEKSHLLAVGMLPPGQLGSNNMALLEPGV